MRREVQRGRARQVTCVACGREFTAPLEKGRLRKFCSRACWMAGKLTPTEKTCLHCSKTFLARYSTGSGGQPAKYCSLACYRAAKDTRITLTCHNCKKEFRVSPSRKKRIYCSLRCRIHFQGWHGWRLDDEDESFW